MNRLITISKIIKLVVFTIMLMLLSRSIFAPLRKLNTNIDAAIIIVYNRVPKCGSTLLNGLFEHLSMQTDRFIFIHSDNYGQYRLSVEEQHKLATDLVRYAYTASSQPIVYDRHFHFVNLTSTPENIFFYYINQLRDPLKRTLSQFDHQRHVCTLMRGKRPCWLRPSFQNLTMNECVSTADPTQCLTQANGIHSPISFFCGQSPLCDDRFARPTSEAALSLAKSNIERYYSHIGLLEYIQSSLELLEYIQPSIFTGITNIYLRVFNSSRVYATRNKHRHITNNKTLAILRQLLKPEYELYNFVRKRFIDHYTRVFHRAPIYHET
jgi:hypothetical protein